jgi:hypothetical protein
MKRSTLFIIGTVAVLGIAGTLRSWTFKSRALSPESAPALSNPDVTRKQERQCESEIPNGIPALENATGQLARLAEFDAAKAAALIRDLPQNDYRGDFTRQVLQAVVDRNPEIAAELIDHLPAPLDWQMASALGSMWGAKDLTNAVAWVTNLARGAVRTQALFSLISDWASRNAPEAAQFVMRTAETDFPLDAADPGGATESESKTSSRVRSQMLEIIGARWAATDPSAAIAWADQLPPGNSRDSVLAGISSTIGETAPTKAAELVASMRPGHQQEAAALTVLLEWGRDDLQAAGDWLGLFPAGDFRHKALLNLSVNALFENREAAQSFLLAWPEPDERAHAIRCYFDETLDSDAAQDRHLLAGIEDISLRSEETARLFQHWLAQDPIAAAGWASTKNP